MSPDQHRESPEEPRADGRIVEPAPSDPRSELAVGILLLVSAVLAVGFVVTYAVARPGFQNQLMAVTLGGALLAFAAALIVAGKRVVATEELEDDYPQIDHPQADDDVDQIVRESGDGLTRRRFLRAAGGTAIAAMGAALLTPIASFGPFLRTRELQLTPWRRGRRLIDERGRPVAAADIEAGAFYTAYPEGVSREDHIGGPVVIVRVDPRSLELPAGRERWAPGGVVAYSKICTHAGCAIALYRKPTFPPVEARPALVCPCHYSTFDPARGAQVIFGPAGRPLPQLPLYVDRRGHLRAAGNLSSPPGPSWWGVRSGPARSD